MDRNNSNASNNLNGLNTPFTSYRNKIKYHLEFLRHTSSEPNHIITKEDRRLREVILQNYFKSFTIGNLFALYVNYIRRNKTYSKTLLSKICFNVLEIKSSS